MSQEMNETIADLRENIKCFEQLIEMFDYDRLYSTDLEKAAQNIVHNIWDLAKDLIKEGLSDNDLIRKYLVDLRFGALNLGLNVPDEMDKFVERQ